VILSFFLAALVAGSSTARAETRPLVVEHVTVIDGTGAPPRPDITLIVRGRRIAELQDSAHVVIPARARRIDGRGKYVIPGLWDMHGHLTDATVAAFPLLVLNGITGMRDLGGDLKQIDRWRNEIARGARLGPHIFRAGPFLDGEKPGVPNRLVLHNEADARRAVDSLKQVGVDFIKVHNKVPRAAFFALMDEARKVGIPVAVHRPHEVTMAEASDAGAKSLEHIEMLLESAAERPGATAKTIQEAYEENTGAAGDSLFAKFVRNGTWYVPTLIAYRRGFALWDAPRHPGRRKAMLLQMDLVTAMHKAGVRMLAGSDFSEPSVGIVPGVDLHEELAQLVECGFTPLEAIQAATASPALWLGVSDSLGTIAPGKVADFLLLDADPTDNIDNTRWIRDVVLGGTVIPVAERRAEMARKP
jgi:imidazolonepropionase-like amidohydrolase